MTQQINKNITNFKYNKNNTQNLWIIILYLTTKQKIYLIYKKYLLSIIHS